MVRLTTLPARSLPLMLAAIVWTIAVRSHPAAAQEQAGRVSEHGDVVVRPGDRVRLKIWREPDLSGEFDINEGGMAVFPKIGRLEVGQMSTDSLMGLLVARYSESIRNPAVEVTVLRRVNVLGAVRNPGLYYVDPTMTVADVVALAGGVSPDGNQNRIELLRGGDRLPIRLSRTSRLADSPLRAGDQLRVPQRSWLSRNTTLVAATLTSAAIVFAATIR